MARDEQTGNSFVFHQPETPDEIAAMEEALCSCPTESIGSDDEDPAFAAAQPAAKAGA
jgi:hypothetical protein